MGRIDELVSEQFASWELRGRGWTVWPHPTTPEPPFCEFEGFELPPPVPGSDDGRKPSFLASLFDRIERRLNPQSAPAPEPGIAEPEPAVLERRRLREFQALLPAKLAAKHIPLAAFLNHSGACKEPISFEILARTDNITVQFAAAEKDAVSVRRHLTTFFPEVIFLD